MKNIFCSCKGFASIVALIIFTTITTASILFSTSIRQRLEIIDNLNKIADDIKLETMIINETRCQLENQGTIDNVVIDGISYPVSKENERYVIDMGNYNIAIEILKSGIISYEFF